MSAIRLASVQVGLPRTRGDAHASDPAQGEWTSAIFKDPVVGRVRLDLEGLAGDGQGDRESHGGPERAVLMYGAAHYPLWRSELGLALTHGAFGENFTIDGLDETTVCIGDSFAIGDAVVQVSQPRGPCWKISRRWNRPELLERVVVTGRTGWYCRVLRAGDVAAGDVCTLTGRPCDSWTVARVAALTRPGVASPAELEFLIGCEPLADERRQQFARIRDRRNAGSAA